jgi:hypothetical protein
MSSWLNRHRAFRAIVFIALIHSFLIAKNKKEVPKAPLPAAIGQARNVFLSNGGGSDLAYDAFYAAMKRWDRYKIVDRLEDADLIAEISYNVVRGGTRVWSSTNTYDRSTQVHSAQIMDPQLTLTIFDPKSKTQLWATVEHRRLARLERNREKETILAAERLVENLKSRMESKEAR